MDDHQALAAKPARRPPRKKGKLVGAKPPLLPSHVCDMVRKRRLTWQSNKGIR
jgi:hypothetical protein